jgi:hypothetical protein
VTNRQTEIDYEDWMASFAADARSSVGNEMFAARMKARRRKHLQEQDAVIR